MYRKLVDVSASFGISEVIVILSFEPTGLLNSAKIWWFLSTALNTYVTSLYVLLPSLIFFKSISLSVPLSITTFETWLPSDALNVIEASSPCFTITDVLSQPPSAGSLIDASILQSSAFTSPLFEPLLALPLPSVPAPASKDTIISWFELTL